MSSNKNKISPAVYMVLVVLVMLSIFNFYSVHFSSKQEDEKIRPEVEDFIEENFDRLVEKILNKEIENFLEDNKTRLVQDLSTDQLDKRIREIASQHILEQPELVVASLQAYQSRQMEKMRQQAEENIKKNIDLIENDKTSPTYGEGKIIITKFFDYNCGYCKKAWKELNQVLKNNKDVKVVFKEIPILGDNSKLLAKYALAVHEMAPNKYYDFHSKLMQSEGSINEDKLEDIAKGLGINPEKLEDLAEEERIEETIDKNTRLANKIGINGTPAFVIGGKLFPGMLSYDNIVESIIKQQ